MTFNENDKYTNLDRETGANKYVKQADLYTLVFCWLHYLGQKVLFKMI